MADTEPNAGTEFLHEEYSPFQSRDAEHDQAHSEPVHSCADIVFVQGLASSYKWTWSVEDSTEPEGRYYWLRQKLPQDVRNGRILAFEYDSSWYENPAYLDIEECATWLLECLIRDRKHPGQKRLCRLHRQKPLILVGHSFGGLVIKQALVMAGLWRPAKNPNLHVQYLNHQALLSAVAGVIFLGTPHRGTTFSKWATLKMNIGSALMGRQVHDELVNLLALDNPRLKSLHRQFSRLLETDLLGLRLTCFYEVHSVSIPPQVVVPERSASLDSAENIPMAANHMQLNKFLKSKDRNYDLFVTSLQSMVDGSRELVERRFASQQYSDTQASFELQNLRRWLDPSSEVQELVHSTRLKEHRGAPFTCSWINDVEAVQKWMASEAPPLWIHGQAGSGKSVLCSYMIDLLANTRAPAPDTVAARRDDVQGHTPWDCQPDSTITVLYFLNGVDKEHEKPWTFVGTLIHQLLLANTGNDRLFQIALDAHAAHKAYLRASTADTEVIISLFEALLRRQQTLYILIDGLEENSELTECLQLLARLQELPNVHFAFFSQDVVDVYSPLSHAFSEVTVIPIKQHTSADVERFAILKAGQLVREKTELAPNASAIQDKLCLGADGIFQWVNESFGYLKSSAVRAHNVDDCLKEMPVGLHSSYEKIFTRIANADPAVRRQVQTALRWLTVAARPLSVRELWTAMRLESETSRGLVHTLQACSANSPSDEEIVDELYELLGSLLRVSRSPKSGYYIQLVHPSLRVAITGRFVDEHTLLQEESFYFPEAAAHLHCARLCMKICAETTLQHAACKGVPVPPLVDYAWTFFAYHRHLSGTILDQGDIRLDSMILGVTRDSIILLNALVDFASTHLVQVRLAAGDLQTTLAVKLAQESLLPAVEAVMSVSQNQSFSSQLHEARGHTKAELVLRPQRHLEFQGDQRAPNGWVARFRRRMAPAPSATLRLTIDTVFAQRPQLGKHQPNVTKLLTRAAQCLRLVAIRFGVEQISQTMEAGSDSKCLSAINCLARVSNLLEECGNYPYWDLETVSANQAYSARFVVPDGDQFYGPARYVLQALDAAHVSSTKVSWRDDDRTVLLERAATGDLQITQAHKQHVDKMYELPGSSYIVATHVHVMFSTHEGYYHDSLVESIKQAHVESSLMLRNISGAYMRADELLSSYAPEALFRNQYREYVRALPQLLKMMYLQYITLLLQVAAGLSKTAIAIQVANLRSSFQDLTVAVGIYANAFIPDGSISKSDLVIGLAAYIFRWLFVRWYSLLYSFVTWRDLYLGLKHPAPFLSIEGSTGFWESMGIIAIGSGIEMLCLVPVGMLNSDPDQRDTWLIRITRAVATFHAFLLVERSVFKICRSLVTTVAAARVMFSSAESVGGVVTFSAYFWIIQFWSIAVNLGGAAFMQAYQLGTWARLSVIVLQIGLVMLIAIYVGSAVELVKKLLYPLILPYWITVYVYFLPWAKILRITGATGFVLMVGWAVVIARQYWNDPYGLRHSISDLGYARKAIRDSEIAQQGMKSLKDIGKGAMKVDAPKPDTFRPAGRVVEAHQASSSRPSASQQAQPVRGPEVVEELTMGGIPASRPAQSAHEKTE